MSENNKKILKAKTQQKLAQYWAQGDDADLKNQNCGTTLMLRDGTITAITQSYDWTKGGWVKNSPIVLAFVNDEGDRIVYNYTGQDLATSYLCMQRPSKWNNNLPRLPSLVYAEIGKGTSLQGISTSLVYKLIEEGKATKILLPPEN